MRSFVLVFLFAATQVEGALHFGTNEVRPGKMFYFGAPLGNRARLDATKAGAPATTARGALILPTNFSLSHPCPLVIVSVPSGGLPIAAMASYTNVALAEGYAVLAGEGPKVKAEADTIQFGWSMVSSVLEQLLKTWPQARQWPMVCAGFSGGAKRSAGMSAALVREGFTVWGVFMGGSNEDRASLGAELYKPGDSFLNVPFFLSNGNLDKIANPQQGLALRESMIKSGFKRVRVETYEGGHKLDSEQLRRALRWFREGR